MKKYSILILTDHTNHTRENSLYGLTKSMQANPLCQKLDVATRGCHLNNSFFIDHKKTELWVKMIDESFCYSKSGLFFKQNLRKEDASSYDVIWLRLPPPLSKDFLGFLIHNFSNKIIINSPKGIQLTGSKEYLTKFPEYCPPMKICKSVQDIESFRNRHPIVLKPFNQYGGKGIIKIDGAHVWDANKHYSFDDYVERIQHADIEYLGVKYLKNVNEGDKRIVIINGKIIGASLRLPKEGSWLCNASQGGQSHLATVDEHEMQIVKGINSELSELGIVIYGIDTLMGDNGRRMLSEINTTSVGGLFTISKYMNKPVFKLAANQIMNYIVSKSC